MNGHAYRCRTRQPKNLSSGAAIWLMNATVCHCTIYSRVMNAAVILEQKDIGEEDSPNVILVNQLSCFLDQRLLLLPWQPQKTTYFIKKSKHEKLTECSTRDTFGIAAMKTFRAVPARPQTLTQHQLTLMISVLHWNRDEWSINAGVLMLLLVTHCQFNLMLSILWITRF